MVRTIQKQIKVFLAFAIFVLSFFYIGTVSAATQYPDGGVWTYGATSGGAFSNYYHGSKYHTSTVVSRWNSNSSRGAAPAGQTSYAYIDTSFGEQAAFYYNYH